MNPATLITLFLSYSSRLKFRSLFLLAAGLFVLDLLIPDAIPFFDEIILGLITIILSHWKKDKPTEEKDGTTIEGEIIHKNDDQK